MGSSGQNPKLFNFFSQQQRKSVSIIFPADNMNSRTNRYIYSLCFFIKKKLLFLYIISVWHIFQHALKNLITTNLLSKIYWPNHNIINKLLCTLIFSWLQGHTGLCEWASFLLCYDSTAYLFMPITFVITAFRD